MGKDGESSSMALSITIIPSATHAGNTNTITTTTTTSHRTNPGPNVTIPPTSATRRPSSIAELAERVKHDVWDEPRNFKHHLRNAERYRREGKEFVKKGDIENGFVHLARAVTLVLEKLPSHRDYNVLLNANQRHNLALNGQDMLDDLSELKLALVGRYDKWLERHPGAADHERMIYARTQKMVSDKAHMQGKWEQFQEEELARQRDQRKKSHKNDEAQKIKQKETAFPCHAKMRLACENCRRKEMTCDPSIFKCSECQRSGIQCTFGEVERGRSRYRARRTQSVPNHPKVSMVLSRSRLTGFPPPPPFPPGLPNVQSQKRRTEQQQRPRVQCEANNNQVLKTEQEHRKIGNQHIIPQSPSLVSFGDSRSRSLSFHRPTERDPRFGRPYSRPSSRPSSKPSSLHDSPISTPGLWLKSPASFQEARVKEQVSSTLLPAVVKSSSRLAFPLPVPPARAARKRDWGNTKTDHLGSHINPIMTPSPRRTQYRRFSRPPSPHPSSRAPSRSSFSIPLERKSSFSRSSPSPASGTSRRPFSRSSSRSSFSSPVQYSPNPSPKGSYAYLPRSTSPFNPQPPISLEPWSHPTSYNKASSASQDFDSGNQGNANNGVCSERVSGRKHSSSSTLPGTSSATDPILSSSESPGTTTATQTKLRLRVPVRKKFKGPRTSAKSSSLSEDMRGTASGSATETQSVNAKKARMYLCDVDGCGKCFVKGEHLRLHVASEHTSEKLHQ